MKTPREILTNHHRAATPKLDALRKEVMSELNRQDAITPSSTLSFVPLCLGGLNKIWRELILPSRRIWAGLATVWIFIFIVNISTREHSQTSVAKASPMPAMILAFHQQEKLLDELVGENNTPPVDTPKIFAPRPSSRREFEILTV